jgi:hypothetical protein
MSAYIVSRKHIHYLVTAAAEYGLIRFREQDKTGQMLWDENIKSVQYRYNDDAVEDLPGPVNETYRYRHLAIGNLPLVDPVVLIKQCQCYDYQSCEHPGWETSAAKRLSHALASTAISRLPGYDQAPWGLD